MPETGTFGDKLLAAIGWAGKHGRRARLHAVVDDAIKRHGVGDGAQQAIMDAIDDDPALMVEMLDELKFRRPLVERFMQKRTAALRSQGATIKTPAKAGDRAGHIDGGAHPNPARPVTNETPSTDGAAATGRNPGGTRMRDARAADEQDAPQGAGGGHTSIDTHSATAPAENSGTAAQDGSGHSSSDTRAGLARPSAPTQTDRAAMIANRNKSARNVLGQASMVSGKPYGDLTKRDLEDEVRRADHRGQFARRVLAEAKFPTDDTPLKRAISEADAAKLWTQAWEAVTHAA